MLQDQLDIAFICGLPFIRHYRVISGQLKAIVAPVMQSSRIKIARFTSPISSSTLSGLKTFDELVGKTLCYNDQGLTVATTWYTNGSCSLSIPVAFWQGYPIRLIKVPSDWLLKDWLTVRRLTAPC